MLRSVKIPIGNNDLWDYRGVGVKWTMVTAIKYISGNSRLLSPFII